MDGSPIPAGGKMTVSVGCFLSGKEKAEGVDIALKLSDYAGEAKTAPVRRGATADTGADAYSSRGGGYGDARSEALLESSPMLLPGDALAVPAEGLPITAAGYAEGLFHVQVESKNPLRSDSHCSLWLEDGAGNRLDPIYSAGFSNFAEAADRTDYSEFVFDLPPQELEGHTLHGDFYTTSQWTEGDWRVTFPLETNA